MSAGVRQAVAYALEGVCDAARGYRPLAVDRAVGYVGAGTVARFIVTGLGIDQDQLDSGGLARWVDGADPVTGAPRGRVLASPDADLFLDATMNMPKSYSSPFCSFLTCGKSLRCCRTESETARWRCGTRS